jgi:hypothetical protein
VGFEGLEPQIGLCANKVNILISLLINFIPMLRRDLLIIWYLSDLDLIFQYSIGVPGRFNVVIL